MRPVGSIDNQGNLRALVIQDLKELGIKVPKAKKAKRLSGAKPISVQDTQKLQRNGIFSNYLSHQTCAFVDGCGYVPEFLVHAAEFIESHTELEGLFRKSGAISRQKELKQQIEDGRGFVGANVYDVTGLIKQFFRELPEPLFTSLYHDTFIKCYQMDSEETATKLVLLLCLLLPKEHISTLRFTMMLLAKIAAASNKNKMDASNLAVVLAPNIMNINSKSEKMNSSEEKLLQHQTSIVELLINNSSNIGMVSESLIERTDMMTDYFGTDDELLESSDVTHERKKKEKRKRSSSFHGIVIRVRQSVSKWRRSTEYKNQDLTTSSAGSNESLHSKSEVIDMTEATPVVIRKRKAPNETVAFSASKKKAILQTLPQNVLLSNTPFTPAAGTGHRHHNADPDRTGNRKCRVESPEYGDGSLCTSTTPSDCSRNHKKRLALFTSPGRKSRRQSPSPKKSGRAKSFLRRLSGGRTEKLSDSQSDVSTSQVGQRLASFNGSSASEDNSCCEHKKRGSFRKHKRRRDSKAEASAVSEIYLSPSSKQLSPSKSLQDMQHESTDDLIPRQCVSDTAIQSNRRSFSADETLDAKMNAIRRGQPNTIANGLLHGKQAEAPRVQVKRSKSINKADIGLPMPVFVPSEGDSQAQDRPSRPRHRHLPPENKSSKKPPASMNDTLMRVVLPPPNAFADRSMVPDNTPDSDHESEAGFSTISGGTVIFVPDRPDPSAARNKDGKSLNHEGSNASSGSSISSITSAHDLECKRIVAANANIRASNSTKSLQPSSSADSLLSMRSEGSPEHFSHELSRSQSTDSGKGSMLDETLADSNASKMLNTAFIDLDKNPDTLDISMNVSSLNASVDVSRTTTQVTKKSVSSDDLQKHAPASICRSRSLYEPLSSKHGNITPNLQISTKTQKILERAGFVKEEKTLLNVFDVHVPPPVVSPSARPSPIPEHPNEESKNIRESILDLQSKNTGKVAENIKNLDNRKSANEADHFASPFRFPQSTTRKRGCSPIRIPTIFVKSDKEAAAKYREIAQLALRRSHVPKGTAKLPISTPLLKPTEQATQPTIEMPKVKGSVLKRRPSIYYSREKNHVNNLRGKSHDSMDSVSISSVSTSCDETCDDITLSSVDRTHNDNSRDNVFDDSSSRDVNRNLAPFLESSRKPDSIHDQVSAASDQVCLELSSNQSIFRSNLDGTNIPINESLKETIYDVCMPLSEKLLRRKDDLQTSSDNNSHKENNICKSDMPLQPFTPIIKQPLIRTPQSSRSVLRTANGMTPRDVLKFSRTPQNRLRSPGKPVKRLGAAKSPGQHSPLKFSKSSSRVRGDVKNNLHAAMLDEEDAL